MNIRRAKKLIKKYRAGDCTPAEKELIESWYQHLETTGKWNWHGEEKDEVHKLLDAKITAIAGEQASERKPPVSIKARWTWIAAASVLLVLGALGYYIKSGNSPDKKSGDELMATDVQAPKANRAMITLSDGRKVYLDSAQNGSLAVQGSVKLIKLSNGEIAYEHTAGAAGAQLGNNTLTNPRGSKIIHIVLVDGTKVWLNSGSELTYPVAFAGNERKVSVKGEAYFEVAHDKNKPFIVNNDETNIKVLGTHFNINAYEDDEKDIKVTLLEGLVSVQNRNNNQMIKPGEQAVVGEGISVLEDVDIEGVMAWKNGFFYFDHASLTAVLNQLARWYDVNVIYQGSIQPREFVGEMQRDLNLSEVLKLLGKNNVKFKIEGNNLIVSP